MFGSAQSSGTPQQPSTNGESSPCLSSLNQKGRSPHVKLVITMVFCFNAVIPMIIDMNPFLWFQQCFLHYNIFLCYAELLLLTSARSLFDGSVGTLGLEPLYPAVFDVTWFCTLCAEKFCNTSFLSCGVALQCLCRSSTSWSLNERVTQLQALQNITYVESEFENLSVNELTYLATSSSRTQILWIFLKTFSHAISMLHRLWLSLFFQYCPAS